MAFKPTKMKNKCFSTPNHMVGPSWLGKLLDIGTSYRILYLRALICPIFVLQGAQNGASPALKLGPQHPCGLLQSLKDSKILDTMILLILTTDHTTTSSLLIVLYLE